MSIVLWLPRSSIILSLTHILGSALRIGDDLFARYGAGIPGLSPWIHHIVLVRFCTSACLSTLRHGDCNGLKELRLAHNLWIIHLPRHHPRLICLHDNWLATADIERWSSDKGFLKLRHLRLQHLLGLKRLGLHGLLGRLDWHDHHRGWLRC